MIEKKQIFLFIIIYFFLFSRKLIVFELLYV